MFFHPRSILLIHSGGLGDLILSLPAVKRLRERFPRAQVYFLGNPSFLRILDRRFYADGIYSMDRSEAALLFSPHLQVVDPLKKFLIHFDSVISWCDDGEGNLKRNLHSAGIGNVLVSSPIRKLKNLKRPKPVKYPMPHASDVFMASLFPTGIRRVRPVTEVYLRPEDYVQADALLISRKFIPRDNGYAVIHVGGGNIQKRWPLDRFLELATWLEEQKGIPPLFLTGPAEEDDPDHMAPLREAFPLNRFHCIALPVLGALIQKALFYVGSDSGISHLASAAGAPTFVIFGVTDPSIWKPVGRDVRVIGPCGGPKESPLSRGKWDQAIWPKVEDVQKEVERLWIEKNSSAGVILGTKRRNRINS